MTNRREAAMMADVRVAKCVWRKRAQAVTGILMCGWSTGFVFAIVSRMYQTQTKRAGD